LAVRSRTGARLRPRSHGGPSAPATERSVKGAPLAASEDTERRRSEGPQRPLDSLSGAPAHPSHASSIRDQVPADSSGQVTHPHVGDVGNDTPPDAWDRTQPATVISPRPSSRQRCVDSAPACWRLDAGLVDGSHRFLGGGEPAEVDARGRAVSSPGVPVPVGSPARHHQADMADLLALVVGPEPSVRHARPPDESHIGNIRSHTSSCRAHWESRPRVVAGSVEDRQRHLGTLTATFRLPVAISRPQGGFYTM